jgi:hypothetical protein
MALLSQKPSKLPQKFFPGLTKPKLKKYVINEKMAFYSDGCYVFWKKLEHRFVQEEEMMVHLIKRKEIHLDA